MNYVSRKRRRFALRFSTNAVLFMRFWLRRGEQVVQGQALSETLKESGQPVEHFGGQRCPFWRGDEQMSCPKCKKSGLVEITLNIATRPVTMRNCSSCDSRWWQSEGESLRLPSVLALASQR